MSATETFEKIQIHIIIAGCFNEGLVADDDIRWTRGKQWTVYIVPQSKERPQKN